MSAIGICSKTRVFKPYISLHERLPKVQRYYLSAHTYHNKSYLKKLSTLKNKAVKIVGVGK